MKRQRLFKAIVCVALAVFVFLSDPLIVLAAESDYGYENQLTVTIQPSYGASLMLDSSSATYYNVSSDSGYPRYLKTVYSGSIPVYAVIQNAGPSGVYLNGSFRWNVYFNYTSKDSVAKYLYQECRLTDIRSVSGSGWSFSFSSYSLNSIIAASSTYLGYIDLSFSDYYIAPSTASRFGDLMFEVGYSLLTDSDSSTWDLSAIVNMTVGNDYVGSYQVTPAPLGEAAYIVDSLTHVINSVDTGSQNQISTSQQISQAEMAQQESIAAAQSSQSAEQHNEALYGFDNSQATSINASLQGGISDYDEVQDDIFNRAVTGAGSIVLDTDMFLAVASSLSFVSTFLDGMFDSLQDFSITISVSMVLLFCLLLLGYYKFRGGG